MYVRTQSLRLALSSRQEQSPSHINTALHLMKKMYLSRPTTFKSLVPCSQAVRLTGAFHFNICFQNITKTNTTFYIYSDIQIGMECRVYFDPLCSLLLLHNSFFPVKSPSVLSVQFLDCFTASASPFYASVLFQVSSFFI